MNLVYTNAYIFIFMCSERVLKLLYSDGDIRAFVDDKINRSFYLKKNVDKCIYVGTLKSKRCSKNAQLCNHLGEKRM